MTHRRSLNSHFPWLVSLGVALAFAACRCDEQSGSPTRNVERAKEVTPTGEGAEGLAVPPPEGTPIDPEKLSATLPNAVGEAKSEGSAELKSSPLPNGGMLTSAKRRYALGESHLTLELMDTQHAPALRALLAQQQAKGHTTETSSWKTVTISGRPGFVQWNGKRETAVATLLVGDRVLVNLQVDPAKTAEVAGTLAQMLPFEAIEKLVAASADEEVEHKPASGATPAAPASPAAPAATAP